MPELLDPALDGRAESNHADEAQLREQLRHAEAELKRCREYGRALWSRLDESRHYLMQDVAGGEGDATAMLHQTQQWQVWAELFAAVSSTLAGRSGDAGFGRSEATLIARAHGFEISPPTP
jgi:hypothetical protein